MTASEKTKKSESVSEKKHIVIATDNYVPRIDGIARFLSMFLPFISHYKISIIAPAFKGKSVHPADITVHRVPLHFYSIGDFQVPKKPKNIRPLLEKADLVFSQTIGPVGSTVMRTAHTMQKPLVSFVHSIEWVLVEKSLGGFNPLRGLISAYVKRYARRLYSRCTAIIVPSNSVAEIFSLRNIKQPKYVIPLGIDTSYFKPPRSKEKAKEALKISPNTFVVGYVGRIAREKDLLTLKRAFDKLEVKDKHLFIVGDGIPSVKKSLKGHNVTITGRKEDVVQYLHAFDVFAMPSLTETTCLATLEAMACEVPVVVTKVGSMQEYVIHKKNGFFFPKRNSLILSLRLKNLYKNPQKAKGMGILGRDVVLSNYQWHSSAKKIAKVIDLHVRKGYKK
ncbi:MAG: glycosyltransferase family 4 protein [Candidatus Woesearchaeota archaeon]